MTALVVIAGIVLLFVLGTPLVYLFLMRHYSDDEDHPEVSPHIRRRLRRQKSRK